MGPKFCKMEKRKTGKAEAYSKPFEIQSLPHSLCIYIFHSQIVIFKQFQLLCKLNSEKLFHCNESLRKIRSVFLYSFVAEGKPKIMKSSSEIMFITIESLFHPHFSP